MRANEESGTRDLVQEADARPVGINRRDLLALFGAAVAGVVVHEGANAAPYSASQVRALAQDTGAGAKIVVASGADLDELDPQYFKSIPSYYLVANIYDNLFSYEYETQADGGLWPAQDANGNWKLAPWLLESWTVSDDQKTLTFVLRKDIVFSDGTPMTAADVKATWDRGVSATSVYSNLVFNLMTLSKPEQITQVDDYTISVALEKPTAFALKMIATNVPSIMSKAAIEKNATADDPTAHNYFHTNTLGSTAYVLANWTPGVQWELAPNPNYWNKSALKNGGVLVRTIPDASQRLSLLKNGDVDLAFDLLPKDMADLKSDPNSTIFDFAIPWPQFLAMNNKVAPFDNVDVRRAVSHAIPYQTIIDQVMFGFAKACKSPVAEGMPTSDYSFWNYDGGSAKAKEILDGLGMKDLAFDLSIRIGYPTHEQIAVWVQSSLAEAGVTVNIAKMTDADYLEKFNSGGMASFIAEWYSWVNDPIYHLYWNFHSKSTATNSAQYSNPQVDQLIDAAMYEPDQAKRDDMSKQAQKIIVDEAPWGILYSINYTVGARKNVQGFAFSPDTAARYWMVSKA